MLKFLRNYNGIGYCIVSLWLAITLIKTGHMELGIALAAAAILKALGMVLHNGRLKQVGIIGMNIIWGVSTYFFITSHVPVNLTYHLTLYVLYIGAGIALRGRFDE